MSARDDLKWQKRKLELLTKMLIEEEDVEESRKLANRIKESATSIVNLRKECKGGYGKKKY